VLYLIHWSLLFYVDRHNEAYSWQSVNCSVHNIIIGKLWIEHVCLHLHLYSQQYTHLTFVYQAHQFSYVIPVQTGVQNKLLELLCSTFYGLHAFPVTQSTTPKAVKGYIVSIELYTVYLWCLLGL